MIAISNHPITGQKRQIRIKQITYVDFDLKEAKVIWEEILLDTYDNPIIHETVIKRLIESHLTNANKVNMQGVLLDRKYIELLNTINEDETEEEYNIRVESLLLKELENGIPEFDFYVTSVLNMEAIAQGILALDKFKRFDRK